MKLSTFSYKEWNLNAKLISAYSITIIIPVIVLTLLGYNHYNENMQKKVGEYGLSLSDQVSKNLDTYIQQIDRMASTFYLDVRESIGGKVDRENPSNAFREKVMVDRALRNTILAIPFSDLAGAYWIADGEVLYSQYGTGSWVDHSGFQQADWYEKVLELDGKGLLIEPYQVTMGSEQKYVFSYARSIVNIANRQSYGVLLLDFSLESMAELMDNSKSSSAGTLFVVDGQGRVVYHPDPDRMGESFPLKPGPSYGYYTDDINGEPTMVHYVRSAISNWTVVNTIEVRKVSNELELLRNLLWISAAVLLLLSITLSAVLTTTIIRPLKELKRLMLRVELGDYNVMFRPRSNDEMNQLGRSFNAMVSKINELVNNVLHMKIYRQQAQVQVLRSQINPHFLYNTLASINMRAEMNGDYEVADMVTLLGKLFRLSLRSEAEAVPIYREMEYVSVYMKLQQIRFPQLKVTTDIPEGLMMAEIPQWIIQPLIENAIVHGQVTGKPDGKIRIRAAVTDGRLTIYVEDNGTGIPPERLDWIRQRLRNTALEELEEGDHIGLQNVHRRILFLCGEGYGLQVEPLPDGGTRVAIYLSSLKKEDSTDA
ncbi:sensor histidine kinase [Paenibacillus pasadenensis]|uniref:cache domain-containing sensor histidine kinase n=1 Tax=Paenibacillus pasadenensis TaxID=217090 RepID=UPI00203E24D6|nr:sensor histidine kinase [Paenibacillus pasadenensis]MCM3747024.1 sensor histidine kinase [Paenibacillus pasadenensis]